MQYFLRNQHKSYQPFYCIEKIHEFNHVYLVQNSNYRITENCLILYIITLGRFTTTL